MIATWMFAATLLALLAGATARCIEYVARLMNRQGRGAWLLALALTCAWPLVAPAVLSPREQTASVRPATVGETSVPVSTDLAVTSAPSLRTRLDALDRPLLVAWGAVSLVLLAHAFFAMVSLHRLARRAESRDVAGRSVLITPSSGPAAFGVLRPRIVLPKWALELDGSLRDLVLRHEVEHVNAADPAVLTLAWLLAALFPWNAGLWWIVRRLRTATELDCDHRVVRTGADCRRYAHLLLLIAQRQGETAFASMIAGAPTTLPLRIAAMHSTPPTRRALRAAAAALAAFALGAVTASPVLARELASVRAVLPASSAATQPAATRPSVPPTAGPLVLPSVAIVASHVDLSRATPAQDTAKKPPKGVIVANPATGQPPQRGYIEFRIDSQVVLAPGSAAPRYPEILKSAGISGVTIVQFVVDTTGRPIPETLKVVRSSHELFTQAVKASLPGLRFLAARVGAQHVKQLAQMIYRFEVQGYPSADTVKVPSVRIPTFEVHVTGIANR
jgi:beta-lactamase regulating signal transducer with metallopeptidase domain